MKRRNEIGGYAVAVAIVCSTGTPAFANSTGVTTEAINNYATVNASGGACWGPGSSLTNRIANANGFRNGLLNAKGTQFTSGANWTDNSVWVSDFRDPERTGGVDADDTGNFDRPGDAMAYYSGHGTCPNTGNADSQPCTTAADCTNPPAGAAMPSFCRIWNGDPAGSGNCMYHAYNRTLAIGNCAQAPTEYGQVNFSNGSVAFGESANSGAWGNAGANGGVNFVVLDASCSLMVWRESETFAAYAGVHAIGFPGTYTGDVNDASDRGSSFANYYAVNPAGSVSYAWAEAIGQVTGGTACTTVHLPGAQQQLSAGGQGFNGCGLNEAVALETSVSAAQGKTLEPWGMIVQDTHDGLGNAAWAEVYECNWDCNNNPGTR